jgi:hypothetical protein
VYLFSAIAADRAVPARAAITSNCIVLIWKAWEILGDVLVSIAG